MPACAVQCTGRSSEDQARRSTGRTRGGIAALQAVVAWPQRQHRALLRPGAVCEDLSRTVRQRTSKDKRPGVWYLRRPRAMDRIMFPFSAPLQTEEAPFAPSVGGPFRPMASCSAGDPIPAHGRPLWATRQLASSRARARARRSASSRGTPDASSACSNFSSPKDLRSSGGPPCRDGRPSHRRRASSTLRRSSAATASVVSRDTPV